MTAKPSYILTGLLELEIACLHCTLLFHCPYAAHAIMGTEHSSLALLGWTDHSIISDIFFQ